LKKVLIVAYLPPHPEASPRIEGLAKFLPEFGWQPIILTVPLPEKPNIQFMVVETPYHDAFGFLKRLFMLNPSDDIRRQMRKRFGVTSKKSFLDFFLTLGGAIINYPDSERGWKPFAIKAGSELLQKENIDALLSSSSPVTSHIIAKELKNQYKIPWVADLRDLWSQNHNYSYGPVRNLVDRRLELKTLSATDALVTLSQPAAEALKMLHKREVYTITNGFDPDKMSDKKVNLTSNFTITYTGQIYAGKQDPSKLLTALKDLISSGTINPKDVEVRFYGYEEGWLTKEIERYKLSNIVKQHGVVPRLVAYQKQRESQLLLLLNWEDPRENGVYTLKIFEYLAAQRPILATGGFGNDVVETLLDETNSGIYCSTTEDIKNALRELYSRYKIKRRVPYNGNIKKINKYSYREMARKFAEILNNLVARGGNA